MGNRTSKKSFDVHQASHKDKQKSSQNGHGSSAATPVSVSNVHATASNVVLESHQSRPSPSPQKNQDKSPVDDGVFEKSGRLGLIDADAESMGVSGGERNRIESVGIAGRSIRTPSPTRLAPALPPKMPTSPVPPLADALASSFHLQSTSPVQSVKVPLATFEDLDPSVHEPSEPKDTVQVPPADVVHCFNEHNDKKYSEARDETPVLDTVVIEKIEELIVSKRGSAVLLGEHLLLEVPEYAVSEPDSDRASIPTEENVEELLAGRARGGSDVCLHEMTSAEVADDLAKHVGEMESDSPWAVIDEPASTTGVSDKSAAATGQGDQEEQESLDNGTTSLLHDIEWALGGDAVFVRGSFSDWQKKPMNLVEQGSFAYTFPITKGVVYFFNFVVDDLVRTDPDREQIKYYVGDTEEDVHSVCVDE